MKITELSNDRVKISAENGVKDLRTNRVYSEVVTKAENVDNFVEV